MQAKRARRRILSAGFGVAALTAAPGLACGNPVAPGYEDRPVKTTASASASATTSAATSAATSGSAVATQAASGAASASASASQQASASASAPKK